MSSRSPNRSAFGVQPPSATLLRWRFHSATIRTAKVSRPARADDHTKRSLVSAITGAAPFPLNVARAAPQESSPAPSFLVARNARLGRSRAVDDLATTQGMLFPARPRPLHFLRRRAGNRCVARQGQAFHTQNTSDDSIVNAVRDAFDWQCARLHVIHSMSMHVWGSTGLRDDLRQIAVTFCLSVQIVVDASPDSPKLLAGVLNQICPFLLGLWAASSI